MILVKREARSNGAEATKTSADGGSVENSFDNLGQKKGQNLCNVLRSMKFKFLSLSSFKRREKSLREKKKSEKVGFRALGIHSLKNRSA